MHNSYSNSSLRLDSALRETHLEFNAGWNKKYNKDVSSYLELTRTTGHKDHIPWQVNLGIRKSF
jgi:outer membrane autotransporter protein